MNRQNSIHHKPTDVKNLLLRKFLLLILYTLVWIYFMIFNWGVFTINLSINLGFGGVQIPPFIILFFFGFLIIGIQSWVSYISNLQKIIYELQQGVEVGKMKDRLVRDKLKELLTDEKNLEVLKKEIGMEEVSQKQEELVQLLGELKSKMDQPGETTAPEEISQKDQSQKDS